MNRLNYICLKIVWWSSWPLLLMICCFLFTGYMISGRFGSSRLLDEKEALALHKLLHAPLITLLLIHTIPATYLALRRWGWIKKSGPVGKVEDSEELDHIGDNTGLRK